MSSVEFENGKLTVDIAVDGDTANLKFKGNIDEDFVPDKLLSAQANSYMIDFNDIKMINSCGIREWITFIEKIGVDKNFTYVNCPQVIIQQMNIVDGFLSKNAIVESFYAPYYNEDTDEEVFKLLKTSDITEMKAPEFDDLEFDAIEKQYFNFINIQSK